MTRPFVATTIRIEEVASTSDLARERVVEGSTPLPLLVRALRQTRGRGRGTNAWWSDAGSLTFTLGLDPAAHGLRPRHEPRLALAVAVAIVETVAAIGRVNVPLGVRWPNDVEAGGRKLGGILPERVDTPNGPRLLVGIGLNVTTRLADAPPEVRSMATSLDDILMGASRPPDADAFLEAFLEQLARTLPPLAAADPALADRWAALDLLAGQRLRVDLGPRIVAGIGRGIDAEGALLLATESETLRLFGGRVLRDA